MDRKARTSHLGKNAHDKVLSKKAKTLIRSSVIIDSLSKIMTIKVRIRKSVPVT